MDDEARFYFVTAAAIVLSLYSAKFVALRSRSEAVSLLAFCGAVIFSMFVSWLLSPFWHSGNLARQAEWLHPPVLVIAVPYVSFLIDYRKPRPISNSLTRFLFEFFILVPAWWYAWSMLELFVFGWVAI